MDSSYTVAQHNAAVPHILVVMLAVFWLKDTVVQLRRL